MAKNNCWEIKGCQRQPGGKNALVYGVCPAAVITKNDGINGGKNSGRYCWKVAGTVCGGKVQGDLAKKIGTCIVCDFFKLVVDEEGVDFQG